MQPLNEILKVAKRRTAVFFPTLRIFGLCYGGFWIYIADLRSQTCGYDGPDEIPGIWGF